MPQNVAPNLTTSTLGRQPRRGLGPPAAADTAHETLRLTRGRIFRSTQKNPHFRGDLGALHGLHPRFALCGYTGQAERTEDR